MTEEKALILKKRALKAAKEIGRTALSYLAFLAISSVTATLFAVTGVALAGELRVSLRIVYILASVSLPFAAYSTVRAFEMYDVEAQRAFFGKEMHKYKIREGFRRLFSIPILRGKLILHFSTFVLISFLLPPEAGFGTILLAIAPAGFQSYWHKKLAEMAISVPFFLVTTILAKTSAHKWWVIAGEGERVKILGCKRPRLRLFLEIAKIFAIYGAGFYVLPAVIVLAISLALMLSLINNPWVWFGIFVFIIFLAFLRRIKALLSRRRFLRRVRRALKASGYRITESFRPTLSVLLHHGIADLAFTKDERVYKVKLIPSVRRKSPMYVGMDGIASSKRTVSFLKIDFFYIMSDLRYDFEAEEGENKIVVFSPMPKRLYFNYGRSDVAPDDGSGGFNSYANYGGYSKMKSLEKGSVGTTGVRFRGPGYVSDVERGIIKPFMNGDRIGEYKVFDPRGFISAIENDCLDRKER